MKEEIIGMNTDKALALLESINIPHRIVKMDGEGMMVTADCNFSRLNLEIENNLITQVYKG